MMRRPHPSEMRLDLTVDKIEELDHIHITLDHAVLDAYGWPHTLTDDQLLEHLLALNLQCAAAETNTT